MGEFKFSDDRTPYLNKGISRAITVVEWKKRKSYLEIAIQDLKSNSKQVRCMNDLKALLHARREPVIIIHSDH